MMNSNSKIEMQKIKVINPIRSRKKKYCEPMCKLFSIKHKFDRGADDDHSMLIMVYDDYDDKGAVDKLIEGRRLTSQQE